MKLIELVYVILHIGLLASLAIFSIKLVHTNDTRSALTTLYALKRVRIMALADSSHIANIEFDDIYAFRRVDRERLLSEYQPFYWQLQFHQNGIYTKNSLSIYRDTPRFADTTHFDRRPLAGDIVAISLSNGQCLSGYNNSNIAALCKNNAALDFRLKESNRLENLKLLHTSSCQERDTFRFYFNDFSKILCGNPIHAQKAVQYMQVARFVIGINPNTGFAWIRQ